MVTGVRRKLATGREAAAPADLALLRAFRKALPRVADDTLDLALGLIGAHQRRTSLADLSDGLDNGWLLLGLTAPNLARAGVLMDPVLVSALVQHQTLGSVSADIPSDRSLTGTDAALAAPLIDDLLKSIRSATVYGTLRVERRMPDVRQLLLLFDAESYLRAELTVDIAVGLHQGRIIFLLPDAPPPEPDEAERDPTEPALMKDTALQVKAELRAVIARLKLPLDTLEALRAGQVLPLLDSRMEKTDLVSIEGRRIATGRLGQADGFRALRLNPVGHKPAPLEDSFTAHGAGGGMSSMGGGPAQDMGGGFGGFDAGPDLGSLGPDDAASEISDLAGLPPLSDGGEGGLDDLSGGFSEMGDLPDLPDLGGPPDLPDLGPATDLPDLVDPMNEFAAPMTGLPDLDVKGG